METLNLNLIPTGANPVAHVSQYDEGRVIRFNLFEGSAVYTLDGTETIECDVKKPDGNVVTLAVPNTSDSYVDVTTTLQTCACAGDNLADIKITKGAVIIATLNFILSVERSPLENGIESDSAIHNLEQQISDAVADQYDADSVVFDAVPTAGHGVGFAVTSEGVKTGLDLKANSADLATVATSGDYNDLSNLPTIPTDLDALYDVTITTPSDDDILVYQNGEWVNMANPASTANFADAYDTTATYNTGDVCIYNNVLYICTAPTTGTFDPSNWTATTIDNVIGSLSSLTTTNQDSLVDAVNEINATKIPSTSILKANFTANSNSAYGTTLTDTINTTKGVYLVVFSLPAMDISNHFGVQLTGTNFSLYGGSYPMLNQQGTCSWLVNVTSATGTLYVRSADGQACNFSYKERGGLNAFKLIST